MHALAEVQNEPPEDAKAIPFKEKTSKAERRAIQEAQRAAKAAAKGTYLLFSDICSIKVDTCYLLL